MKPTLLLFLTFIICLTACKEMPETDDILTTESSVEAPRDSLLDGDIIENETMINKKADNSQSFSTQKKVLIENGFQVMEIVDDITHDTILMQQYFMVFLKSGPVRDQNEEEARRLQVEHLEHLNKMYEMGYADISGPFGDDGEIRGVTVYNVPTLGMADSLANLDPMVRAKRLVIEVHPWWAMKSAKLR